MFTQESWVRRRGGGPVAARWHVGVGGGGGGGAPQFGVEVQGLALLGSKELSSPNNYFMAWVGFEVELSSSHPLKLA